MSCDVLVATADSAERMREAGACLAKHLQDGDVVALTGGLGAGKTQFAQGVGAGLRVKEQLTSPTFNIVFEYESGRIPLFHFDLYRLQDPLELEDIDFFALTDASSEGASLVEWADMFEDEMPEDMLVVRIEHAPGAECLREISARPTGPRAQELLSAWRVALEEAAG